MPVPDTALQVTLSLAVPSSVASTALRFRGVFSMLAPALPADSGVSALAMADQSLSPLTFFDRTS